MDVWYSVLRSSAARFAGEQEWWVPDEQDLEVLKNCDEDLRIHPRAFRAVGDRPSPADDRSLLDKSAEMDKSLNELPADDPSKLDAAFDFGSPVPATPVAPATPTAQAPRPTPLLLDEQGQPVQESPMFSPMMFVPRTPRSSPGTPRTRARSRSTTRTAPMETRAEGGAPEQDRRPSDLALPGPSGTRPSGTAEMERLVSGSDRTNLPGQDPPSDRALPGSHGNSRRASFESGPGLLRQQSQQSGPLPSIDESSQRVARGLKRPPDVAVGELGSTSSAVAKTMTGPNSSTDPTPSQTELESTVHLLFCKDCGEQYRIFPKECPRCGGSCSVSSPLQVVSWLDEVKEREAFDNIVGLPRQQGEFVPPEYHFDKTDEIDYYQTPADALVTRPTSSKPGMHRLDILRRHGRGGHLRHGWDGSPSEVQLFMYSDIFLTAAHLAGADQPEDPPMEIPDYKSLMTTTRSTSSTTSLSEGLAKLLLQRRDFEHDSCHQLLEVVSLRKPSRQCLSSTRPGSGTLTLGYFSHGRQLGFTKDTWRHQHLARYLAKYLRFHGMQGDISSVFIACNVHSMYHKDRHNSRGSLNWQISHGDYVGGDLWVEREDHDHKYHLMTERMVCGRARFGYVLDTRRRLQAFRPDRHHGSDDFVGNRYVITAYKTRLVQAAPVEHLRELKALNFQTHEKTDGAQVMIANNAPLYPEATSEDYVPVTSAYPVKEQTSASSTTERVIALESSSEEEGHDGSFETRRAELQARKKEIHWRSLTEEEIPAFVEAVRKEWAEWERWSSCKEVRVGANEVPNHLILRSRLCYRWKPVPEGQRAKARIVIAGFKDPHLAVLTRDAPVLARTSFHLILQWSSCHRVKLHNGDCKSAFLQGEPDDERPEQIFMKPPQDPLALEAVPVWRIKEVLYRLSAPVYGQSNAPRRWFDHFAKVLKNLGWRQHSLDPCLFLWREHQQVLAVLGLHVDDLIAAALPGHEEILKQVEASFTWGAPWVSEDFTFIGRRVQQHEDGSVTVDQATYVNDIPTTKVKLPEDTLLSSHPELVTEFRSGIGSLQWLSSTTRGDVAADVSLVQRPPKELTVADLKEVNSVLRYVKATPDAKIRIVHIPLESLVFVAYGDSGFANAPNNKSQGGLVIVATDRRALREPCEASLLEWKSYRHQRVLRSTLAAEASALDRSHDHARGHGHGLQRDGLRRLRGYREREGQARGRSSDGREKFMGRCSQAFYQLHGKACGDRRRGPSSIMSRLALGSDGTDAR